MVEYEHKCKIKLVYNHDAQAYFFSVKCIQGGSYIAYTPFWDYALFKALQHLGAYVEYSV
jgi:hypothetical protein